MILKNDFNSEIIDTIHNSNEFGIMWIGDVLSCKMLNILLYDKCVGF